MLICRYGCEIFANSSQRKPSFYRKILHQTNAAFGVIGIRIQIQPNFCCLRRMFNVTFDERQSNESKITALFDGPKCNLHKFTISLT